MQSLTFDSFRTLGLSMNRTSIIALVHFRRDPGYLLSFGADSTRKLQASVLSIALAISEDRLRFGKADHFGAQRLEIARGTGSATISSLRVENRSLKATNQALRDVEHEVNRLRHALNYRERSVFKLVPAEIVTRDSSTWWRTVTINRGKEDGIESDMPVVTDEGWSARPRR